MSLNAKAQTQHGGVCQGERALAPSRLAVARVVCWGGAVVPLIAKTKVQYGGVCKG